MEDIKIIASYKHFVAVYKPAGILSQGAEGQKDGKSMVSLLSEKLGREVFPIHRLDRETAGAMVFATDKTGASKLSSLVASGGFHKTYLAVCEGEPKEASGEMHDLLFFDRQKNKSFVVDKARSGVKDAALFYEVIEKAGIGDKVCSLVRIKLYTGRTHQIRVQFASRAMPLIGDARYGSHIKMPLALFSHKIEFTDPFTDDTVTIVSPIAESEASISLFHSDF